MKKGEEKVDVFEGVREILREILDVPQEKITEESSLEKDLGAESIDLMEIAAALNSRFKIPVNEEDLFLRGSSLHLPPERVKELKASPPDVRTVKVKDLVSYVTYHRQR